MLKAIQNLFKPKVRSPSNVFEVGLTQRRRLMTTHVIGPQLITGAQMLMPTKMRAKSCECEQGMRSITTHTLAGSSKRWPMTAWGPDLGSRC